MPIALPSTALLTDHYELTMVAAALRSGAAQARCVFEVFTRAFSPRRRYGVLAGTGRLLDAIERFRFGPDELDDLRAHRVVDPGTAEWLAGYRFSGDIDGHPEGEVFFPDTPVLSVVGTFAECVLLETIVLSVLNHDSAIASAAARMVGAAGTRPVIEMGSRRTHELAAVAAARAAHLAGFASTSNLEAGRRHGVPTAGTAAHAFVLAHSTEREAFEAQVGCLGAGTTLLVDTFDVLEGVRSAVSVAGPGLGAVRIDSGDLAALAFDVRAELDALGAFHTRIVVTGDLDEYAIAALSAAPVDSYGAGTALVTGSGVPTAGFIYKIVERDGVAVEKTSAGKSTRGGRKILTRRYQGETAAADVVRVARGPADRSLAGHAGNERMLHVPLMRAGERTGDWSLAEARERCRVSLAELPREAMKLSAGQPALPTLFEG